MVMAFILKISFYSPIFVLHLFDLFSLLKIIFETYMNIFILIFHLFYFIFRAKYIFHFFLISKVYHFNSFIHFLVSSLFVLLVILYCIPYYFCKFYFFNFIYTLSYAISNKMITLLKYFFIFF